MRRVLDKYDPFHGITSMCRIDKWDECDAFHWMKVKLDLKNYVINVMASENFSR
jgi:hypothetical protein